MQRKCHRWFFYTFESIYIKYIKSLQSGCKFELSISKNMQPHGFRSGVRSYIFIFLAKYLDYIFFFSYVTIFHLLWRREGVGIYCKLIPDWIESTRAWILFTDKYITGIQNYIWNTTWRSISKIAQSNQATSLTLFIFFDCNFIHSL